MPIVRCEESKYRIMSDSRECTPISNELFDEWMCKLSNHAFKIICYMAYRQSNDRTRQERFSVEELVDSLKMKLNIIKISLQELVEYKLIREYFPEKDLFPSDEEKLMWCLKNPQQYEIC